MPGVRFRPADRSSAGRRRASRSKRTRCRAAAALKRARVLARTLLYFLIMRSGLRVGGFVPATYLRQVVENSDFRKYDDGLRMIIDCTADLADALERRLAAAAGTARYGLHRQDAAMMTCFTPSPTRSDHVHFIDGAQGGYAAAATTLKAPTLPSPASEGGVMELVLPRKRERVAFTFLISPTRRRRLWRSARPARTARRRRRWRRRSCRRPRSACRLRAA